MELLPMLAVTATAVGGYCLMAAAFLTRGRPGPLPRRLMLAGAQLCGVS
jgi:hypothetical protein